MCFNTAYKFMLCMLRRLGSLDDRVNAPIAGFISALSLCIDNADRRQLITILTMSRGINITLTIGENSGAIPRLSQRDLILFVLANWFL